MLLLQCVFCFICLSYTRAVVRTIILTCMSQAQSPEPQVRRRVGDATQTKLYCVDGLMQELVCKVKLRQQQNKTQHHSTNTRNGC